MGQCNSNGRYFNLQGASTMQRTASLLLVIMVVISFASSLAAAEPAKKNPEPPQALATGKSCEGTLKLGGKTFKLEHVVVYRTKIFDDEGIAVLVSDTPIPVDKLKTALRDGKGSDDSFNLFQPHAKVTFNKEGKVQFSNSYGGNTSLSVSGPSLSGELNLDGGRARGNIRLEPGDEKGHKGSFDARFDVAMLVTPPLPETKPADEDSPKAKKANRKSKSAPAGTVNVRDLPMPKDATHVEYKKLVEHIGFESASSVTTLAAFLSQKLEEQGWTKPDSDLVTAKSAILKRERGEANLTIFIKPSANGSKVTIMSEGLSWEDAKQQNP
jgi:hypothetical protein